MLFTSSVCLIVLIFIDLHACIVLIFVCVFQLVVNGDFHFQSMLMTVCLFVQAMENVRRLFNNTSFDVLPVSIVLLCLVDCFIVMLYCYMYCLLQVGFQDVVFLLS